MGKLILQIHKSIRGINDPEEISVEIVNSKPLLEYLKLGLTKYPSLLKTCIRENSLVPGILYISNDRELKSLGLMSELVDENTEIFVKIVPILHGG